MYVKWQGAHGSGGVWEPFSDAVASSIVASTVGWLTDQDEMNVNLVQTIATNDGDDDAFFNRLNIPKRMILEMHEIKGFDV